MLVQEPREFIGHVRRGGFALPAFNVCNLEMAKAAVEAAELEKAPVIVQTYVGDVEHAGLELISGILKTLAEAARVPVLLHHDHASEFDYIVRVLKAGYGSCMVDTHHQPSGQAAAYTAEVARVAHALGAAVEGELGSWDGPDDQTDPALVRRFLDESRADMLAVSVGSRHAQASRLDLALLADIAGAAQAPLVLHGGSGIDPGDLRAAVGLGVVKVNIGAAFSRAWVEGSLEAAQSDDPKYLHYRMLGTAMGRVREAAREKLRLLGAAGRA